MTKRRVLRWTLILGTLVAFTIWLEPTRVVWGWLRGEAFYDGRPTSWWAAQIRSWAPAGITLNDGIEFVDWTLKSPEGCQAVGIKLQYHDSPLRALLKHWFEFTNPEWPAILDADPRAVSILRQLLDHTDAEVRAMARLGWMRMRCPDRGPVITLWLTPEQTISLELAARRCSP